ncbi:MAG: hypothetical protein HFJ75_02355 [Eggerthellaceae bacterium]|nr:hypothetical protein [Eggerthellaceae bacterium]
MKHLPAFRLFLAATLCLSLTPLPALATPSDETPASSDAPSTPSAGLEDRAGVFPVSDTSADPADTVEAADEEVVHDKAVNEDTLDDENAEGPDAPDAMRENAPAAAEVDVVTPAEQVAPAAASSYDHAYTEQRTSMTLTVEWDDAPCGTPTTFHVTATDGPGNYIYQLSTVYLWDEDGDNMHALYGNYLTDPSRHTENGYDYQASPDISFTFTASGTYHLYFGVMGRADENSAYVSDRIIVPVTINDPKAPTVKAKADQVAAACLAAGNTTDFDKALWLHDWVIDHMEYDNNLLYCGAEGGLTRGTGTCESYHRALVKLYNRVGIQTGRMEGNGHVWTAAKLDGKWYQIDATWDDPGYELAYLDVQHLYFGLTDDIMTLIHSDHTAHAGYESTSLADNYFIKTGAIKQYADPCASQAAECIASGATTFSLTVPNASWPDAYKNVIYNLVAHDLSQRTWKQGSRYVGLKVTYANDTLTATVVPATVTTVSDPAFTRTITYSGSTVRPLVTSQHPRFTFGGTTQATAVGTYSFTATPAPGYAWDSQGSCAARTYTWSIQAASLSGSNTKISGINASYPHTGSAISPTPAVTWNGTRLVAGRDYTVSYRNNVNAGTATIVVTGKGNFTGSTSTTFAITTFSATVSADQKTVSLKLPASMVPGATGVSFPVWSNAGGQDDIAWYPASRLGNEWVASVPVSRHATAGSYAAHAYATINGSSRFVASTSFSIASPTARVSISQTANQKSAGTFTVTVDNISCPSGVSSVQVPVWSSAGGQDDIEWLNAVNRGNGRWTAEVSLNHPRRDAGIYNAHVYLRTGNGIYACAATTQGNVQLAPVTFTAVKSKDERTVTLTASGGWFARATNVSFPVWSNAGGQDDIVWYSARKSNGTWTATIPISSHRTAGSYAAHAYATVNGSTRFMTSTSFSIQAPTAKVSITQSAAQKQAGRFTVTVTGVSSPSGVSAMQAPTWSAAGGQDDIEWLNVTNRGNGTWAVEASINRARRDAGTYHSHIYITAGNGITACAATTQAVVQLAPATMTATVSKDQRTVTLTASGGWLALAQSVSFPVWSSAGGQDDIVWYSARKGVTGAWTCTVPISNHRTAGQYLAHCYVMANGVQRFAGQTSFAIAAPTAKIAITQSTTQQKSGRFTVTISGISSPSGVTRVQVPVWSTANGQDDIEWLDARNNGNGTWSVETTSVASRRAPGTYAAHCYIACGNGVYAFAGQTSATVVRR